MLEGCVYFVSRGKGTAGTILPSTNRMWRKGKIAPTVVFPDEAK